MNSCEIQNILYKLSYPFKKKLEGLIVTVPHSEHKINNIKSFFVLDAAGIQVAIEIKITLDQTVQVIANLDMSGLTLYLY